MRSIYDIINASALGGMQANYQNPADRGEYDYEGEMAKNQLLTIADAAEELYDMLEDDENLPEWVQNKITKAADYIDSVRDYMVAKDVDLDDEDMYGDDDDMYESTDLGEEVELEEKYSKSIGYKGAEDMINRLSKILNPNSNLCKGISRDADNVVPEFKKMQKAMDQINSAWDEVERTVEESMNEAVELDEATLDLGFKTKLSVDKDGGITIVSNDSVAGRQIAILEPRQVKQIHDTLMKKVSKKVVKDLGSKTKAVFDNDGSLIIITDDASGKQMVVLEPNQTKKLHSVIMKEAVELDEAKKVQGRKLTAKEIKAALASGKAQAKPKDQVSLAKTPWDDMKEDLSDITEKLSVAQGVGAWIDDFKKSDAPQFKGKSEKERRDMALAAYLSRKNEK